MIVHLICEMHEGEGLVRLYLKHYLGMYQVLEIEPTHLHSVRIGNELQESKRVDLC